MKCFLFVVLTLAAFAPVRAQVYPPPQGEMDVKYDRFTDKTRVTLRMVQVAYKEHEFDYQRLYLTAGAEFDAMRPTRKPDSVGIIFSSWSLWNDRYTEPTHLHAIVDGERKSYGVFTPVERQVINGKYVVSLVARLAYDDLLLLINAKKVDMRLGDLEFSLDAHAFKMLRDFAWRIRP